VIPTKVVADEGGARRPAELFERLEGRVLGAAPGEAAQHLLGLGGAQAQGGGVLDELVVVAGDQLSVDGPGGHHRSETGPGLVVVGARSVEVGCSDVLEPGQQVEAQQMGKSNPTMEAPWVST
jgi:hypothetical protein